ncbi:putative methyltransferase WBSCR22 [Fasciola hepatica]|uniref:Methyltransferase WBSCR22 n=1 Tax=Fasciola hepatica TaxID=6192 RepID=A0A4E0R2M6_FASHE|nr:putative methyltransferase WBSCR22 [Fasciola hepatica]
MANVGCFHSRMLHPNDFPHISSPSVRRYFLVLDVSNCRSQPEPLTEGGSCAIPSPTSVVQGRLAELRDCRQSKKLPKHSVAWIKHKKERARKQMKQVAHDSKYTGRKRPQRL